MNKLFPYLKFSFFILGYTFLSFLVYGLAVDTYQFWVSGIEKQARVVSLDHVKVHTKGSKTYYYKLEIDSNLSIHGFDFELIKNEKYNILAIKDGKIILESKNSSLFHIFKSVFGFTITYSIIAFIIYMSYKLVKYYFTRPKNPYN
ncbi:hypothetical protein EDB69_4319 [Vibrio crassostreae]|uniref:hypothetical protein n=1 Tax=Vibrio crassostreae TaxID=246167 RepID=UPI000F483537|nr:hypothetical protein [Vibrio crassostreae]ROO64976.1 hypothetical protein EDB64_4494 [Vibrio crassostreae]ROP02433.1 hypothetical protein EDB63_4219 [Vibrio crassostreae]ROP14828.1 hypothetical protein EDB33_11479 [Vibrio crassostreae]ROP19920.1 hypothetical protein EDB34_11479 [Vibrio crassostreae]ROQ71834.1 hypothetical protein EDB72_4207 [Vibrio crassostreae]